MQELQQIAGRILDAFKGRAEGLWDGFNESDREIVQKAALDAAKLQIKELAGHDQSSEWKYIKATFDNMAVAEVTAVRNAFWDAVKDVVGLLAPAVTKALVGL